MKGHFALRTRWCFCFLWLLLCPDVPVFHLFRLSGLSAQTTFTRNLTRPVAGEGRVTLHQDAEIDALVNGTAAVLPAATSARSAVTVPKVQPDTLLQADTAATESVITSGRRVRANGYRIQVYAGGNNRQAKSEAYRMANLVRANFDGVQVYTHFISPRWICRVGDFRTYEEATDMLRRMRETQKFREASIVKSKIILLY